VKPEEIRREIKRLEDRRLRLAPEVMGGTPSAVEEDRRLERRIMELASSDRDTRADELRESWRRTPGRGRMTLALTDRQAKILAACGLCSRPLDWRAAKRALESGEAHPPDIYCRRCGIRARAGIPGAEAVAAMDELYRLDERTRTGSDEETTILVCPNPHANLVDAGGVTFVDGRAEVPRSLARKYLQDMDGYTTEED